MMGYTRGKWKVYKDRIGRITIVSEEGSGELFFNQVLIATMNQFINSSEANANLATAAVNACASVNPDNPLAVAESIKDMYEALKALTWDLRQRAMPDKKTLDASLEALSKAEGGR